MTELVARPSSSPFAVGAWVLAARPKTLAAALAPVAVGSACAHAVGSLRPVPALAALAGAILIQVGTNFANDVFDHEKGADGADRLGPTRAVASGLLTPRAMRAGTVVAFGAAALVGLYLAWVAGPLVVGIGAVSVAAGVAYTGGPYPLGYHGLGDVFVFVFFGLVAVCGTVFVQAGSVPALAVLASLPVGALSTAILVVNNVRDRETDAVAGKRTLAVRFGRGAALAEHAALHAVAQVAPALCVGLGLAGAWALLPLGTAPLSLLLCVLLARRSGRALNPLLGATAMLLLLHASLLTVGIALGP